MARSSVEKEPRESSRYGDRIKAGEAARTLTEEEMEKSAKERRSPRQGKTPAARRAQLANLRLFKPGDVANPHGNGARGHKDRKTLRSAVRAALETRLTPEDLQRMQSEGIEVDANMTYREALAAKLMIQSLFFGKAGDKATDQLIALEPREVHIEADARVASLNATVLAKLSPEELKQMRALRAKLAKLAGNEIESASVATTKKGKKK
jgi:hypothetical protein